MEAQPPLTSSTPAQKPDPGAGTVPTASAVPPLRPNRKRLWLGLGAAILVGLIVVFITTRPRSVLALHPQERTVVESIAASGQVHGSVESSLGAAVGGRVARMLVREGDMVRQGQILAYLDTRVLQAEQKRAKDGLLVAQARLVQASRPALPSEVARVRAETAQAIQVGRANLDRGIQRLAELRRGPTPEAKLAARGHLEQAEAHLKQAAMDLRRQRALFNDGQVPRAALDQALTNLKVAQKAKGRAGEKAVQARRDLERERQLYRTNHHSPVDDAENLYRVAKQTYAQRTADLTLALQETARQERLFQGGATPRADLERASASGDVAEAAKELAEANLGKALTDLNRQKALFRDGKVPKAAVGRAASDLRVANAESDQARLQLAQAQSDFGRQKLLYANGSRTELDHAAAAYGVAGGEVTTARAQLRDLQIGTRPESLRQAEADVAVGRATLLGAQSSGAAQIKVVLAQPRWEDVELAQAQVDEARQTLKLAAEKLRQAVVIAPFSGIVTSIVTEIGGVTGATQPVLKLVQSGVPEIRLDVDENNLGRLKVGQRAVVSSNAFPGAQFQARLRQIGAEVNAQRGTVELRMSPVAPPTWLRPGQTLNVNVIVDEGSKRLTIPITALASKNGRTSVFTVRDGRAHLQAIQAGPTGDEQVPVTAGLSSLDLVIDSPGDITSGQKVRAARSTNE